MFFAIATVLILLQSTPYAQSCISYPPSSLCTIDCNYPVQGSVSANRDLWFIFENEMDQKITFTNCDSTGSSAMSITKLTSSNVVSDSNYQQQASNDCPGDHCSKCERQTFAYEYLEKGSFWVKYSNTGSASASYNIRVICHILLAPIVTYTEGFPGATLMVKGFNILTEESAGSPILDYDYIDEMTDLYSTEGASCLYSSLTFDDSYSSWSSFASSDSGSIETAYGVKQYEVGGSTSLTRTTLKTHLESGQYYIYSLNLDCKVASANLHTPDRLYWNSNFVAALSLLPTTYTGDLAVYKDFWQTYGTHMIKSAKLGGKISGATIVSQCIVENKFSTTDEYEICLNGAYKGVEVDGCYGGSNSETLANTMASMVEKTQIMVKGGDPSTFTQIFNTFGDKETKFGQWLTFLQAYPDIVGGDLDEIHDVIKTAIALGNHKLNLDDSTLIAIVDALGEAYMAYVSELKSAKFFSNGECSVDCNGFTANLTECICIGCSSAKECCPVDHANEMFVSFIVKFLFFLVCYFVF